MASSSTHTIIGSTAPARRSEPRYGSIGPTPVEYDAGKGDRNTVNLTEPGPASLQEQSPFKNVRGGSR